MKTIFSLFTVMALITASVLSLHAERIDLSEAQMQPEPGEIWFHVDGFDFSAIEGETECVVRDANVELFGCETSSYCGVVIIPGYIEEDGITYTVVGIEALGYGSVSNLIIPSTIRWIKGIIDLYKLESLEIPESVETIQGCSSLCALHSLSLPSHPIDLSKAFYGLRSLEEVIANSPEPYPVGEWTFYDTPVENCVLVVPDEAVEKYRKAPKWKEFGTIVGRSGYTGINSVKAVDKCTFKQLPDGFAVSGYQGNLKVYDITGKTVIDSYVQQDCSFILPAGAYIICAAGSRNKIIVK